MVYNPPVRRNPLPQIVFAGVALLICGVGVVATLWGMGVIDLPFLRRAAPPSTEGLVAVPLTGQKIPRYTRVKRDHLFNPKTSRPMVQYMKPQEVPPNVLLRHDMIVGRVVKRDKAVGYALTEDDFFPRGTAEGMAGGIPPGKVGLTIEPDKIHGIQALRQGDHFDLVASLTSDDKHFLPNSVVTRLGADPAVMKSVGVKVLVRNGVIVVPVTDREVPTGPIQRGRPVIKNVQEVVVALDSEEVGPLTAALAVKAQLTCFPRSGRPDDPTAEQGLVPVPVVARPVPRYARVTREHLVSPLTGNLMVVNLKPSEVTSGMLTRPEQILGRVVKHEKAVGYTFTEDDLFPAGTPEGIAAGIPPGKLALPIAAEKIHGIHALRQGDHFDLVSSLVPENPQSAAKGMVSRIGADLPLQKHALVRVLVHNGVVVVPATNREVPTGHKQGDQLQTMVVPEVVIAVAPAEVAPLAEALALKTEVTCFPRSGRDDPAASLRTPDLQPASRHYIEIIQGSKRRRLEYTVPSAPPAPVAAVNASKQ